MEEKTAEEKGVNLKQFVMSMRKKNDIADKYLRHKRFNSTDETHIDFDPRSIQEFTDTSLKYIHSFLPHHVTIEQSHLRNKKSIEFITMTPQNAKIDFSERNPKARTIENSSLEER